MILCTLKPCCNECKEADIEVNKVYTIGIIGEHHSDNKTKIFCKHQKICKYYEKCEQMYKVEVVDK